jgi:RNA polymerase sigma-70 factor (ECF subfamily)
MAKNILSSHQDAEECVNDTYLAIWNVIPPKRPEPLAPFVYRTGRNIALNRLRANTALKRSAYEVSLDELSGCIAGPDLWETVDARELGRQINAFLATISRENRVIFLRRYWFGDSVKDIAADLQLSENTVSVRLSRLRDKLRSYLSQEGFYE